MPRHCCQGSQRCPELCRSCQGLGMPPFPKDCLSIPPSLWDPSHPNPLQGLGMGLGRRNWEQKGLFWQAISQEEIYFFKTVWVQNAPQPYPAGAAGKCWMCEEFLIKCPFACFAQVCPRKTRCSGGAAGFWLESSVSLRLRREEQTFLSVWAECRGQSQGLGWMLPQSKGFSHFLSTPEGCTSFRKQQLSHLVAVLGLISALRKWVLWLQINTVFSYFWGFFFSFWRSAEPWGGGVGAEPDTRSVLSPSLTISSNTEPNAALGFHFGVSFLFPRPPRGQGQQQELGRECVSACEKERERFNWCISSERCKNFT